MKKNSDNYFHSITNDLKIIDRYAKNGFCIISAYKPEYSELENKNKNKKLHEAVHSKNLKFIEVVGHWEDNYKESDKKIEAKILFIPFSEISIKDDLIALSVFLMTKFLQETIVFYEPDSSILLYKNDRVSVIKRFNFKKIIKKKFFNKNINPGKKFVIDGRVIANGFFEELHLKKKGYIV